MPQCTKIVHHVVPIRVVVIFLFPCFHLVLVKVVAFPHLGDGSVDIFLFAHLDVTRLELLHCVVEVFEVGGDFGGWVVLLGE